MNLTQVGNYKTIGRLFWVLLLPVGVLAIIAYKLDPSLLREVMGQIRGSNMFFGALALVLLPVNIGLEGLNWHIINSHENRTSYWQSMKIILSGRSLNTVGPLGLGDAYMRYDQWPGKKINSTGWILVERLLKAVPTLCFGILSTGFLVMKVDLKIRAWAIILVLLMMVSIFVLIFYRKKIQFWIFSRFEQLREMPQIRVSLVLKILAVAIIRYAVFATQFYLIFRWVGISLEPLIIYMGVFWILFIKSSIPNLTAIGDLTKRELSAVTFFSNFTDAYEPLVTAGILAWVINIIIPALMGIPLVIALKYKRV